VILHRMPLLHILLTNTKVPGSPPPLFFCCVSPHSDFENCVPAFLPLLRLCLRVNLHRPGRNTKKLVEGVRARWNDPRTKAYERYSFRRHLRFLFTLVLISCLVCVTFSRETEKLLDEIEAVSRRSISTLHLLSERFTASVFEELEVTLNITFRRYMSLIPPP
jgi:hypothetical protein